MDYIGELTAWIAANLQGVLLFMTAMICLALIVFININIKLSRMNRRYRKLMQGVEGANLEKLLLTHIEEVRDAVKRVDSLSASCRNLEGITRNCVQKVGIVRFNAFEDTGSDLSFAIALLDAQNNGVVISNIFGRNESRTYAKPIANCQSQYFLTEEEKAALEQAWKK
ncbi:DUF4446 family protein [Propionispora vibrioides]|jgi:hypothetical protein|uniref:DUF4446 domain-containing protein n=1 Tax=Propionispora vibrioides TaxID=112903 RepID=A0A1H8XKU2_9FIRM|nr:DUF4446 family protein [Propionispora vibrioides]SEP40441.1 Protein of unknown function [Propionispora vibrioides]